jgi:hypothetical protein
MTGSPPPVKYALAAGLGILAVIAWAAIFAALDSSSLRHGLWICDSALCSLCAAGRSQRFVKTGRTSTPKGLR